jgi:hypothetical protein
MGLDVETLMLKVSSPQINWVEKDFLCFTIDCLSSVLYLMFASQV